MLGFISMVFPEKGICFTEKLCLHYPTFSSLFFEKKGAKVDITSIINLADEKDKPKEKSNDTTFTNTEMVADSIVKVATSIQYKNANKSACSFVVIYGNALPPN